ncbi:MAG: AAA family ATPase [Candidatus Omnitrophica bacterium]|nr:AAA family ATPase [Candidatus Omnitrophota bacterium]
MLTKLILRNFKRFDEAIIELGEPVVLIGPNNSGKTTVLQALSLWDIGLRTWIEKRGSGAVRTGVPINRKDLFSLPVPSALFLWNELHVRETTRTGSKQRTENVRIDILVEGVSAGRSWACGLEFDYFGEEVIYCRPMRMGDGEDARRMPIPDESAEKRIAYLPPMSGLADREFVKQTGEIGFLIGQGQTAQVLRNVCLNLFQQKDGEKKWEDLASHLQTHFGIKLLLPTLVSARSEITLAYLEKSGREFDLSCAGRGFQQTLLLLAFLYGNHGSVLLLDEPDAHLEILRQREIFNLLVEVAARQKSQIIAASHSEVVLNEAAGRGKVVAFVGSPHIINDRGTQVLKALTDIGFDQYYQAELKGWVLYLEGPTDLDILRAFAEKLQHPVLEYLKTPFLFPVATNLPQRARSHFYGLCESKSNLKGIAIFDRLEKELNSNDSLVELMWNKREIENYFCTRKVLLAYAVSDTADDLFGIAQREQRIAAMEESIADVTKALQTLGKGSPWSDDIKVTDDFLDPLFKIYSEKLRSPIILRKNEYYKLAAFVEREELNSDIGEKLDAILEVAKKASPGFKSK